MRSFKSIVLAAAVVASASPALLAKSPFDGGNPAKQGVFKPNAGNGASSVRNLVVDTNLGLLGFGVTNLSGTTVGQPNNANTYNGSNVNASWVEEFVYQFSIAVPSIITMTSNDPNAGPAGPDNDFFLLSSLTTTNVDTTVAPITSVTQAVDVIPSQPVSGFTGVEVSGGWGLQPAGTYYLVADAFRGAAANPSTATAFSIGLSLADVPPPPPGEPTGVSNPFTATGPWAIPGTGTGAGTGAPTNPYPLTVNVSGIVDPVVDINVTLTGLSHTWPDDVDVLLVSPTGAAVMLMSDAGGSGDIVGVNLTFSDEALAGLSDGGQIASGTYTPSNFDTLDTFPAPAPAGPYSTDLSALYALDPNGTWSLYIVDDASGDTGTLSSFTIDIVTVIPEPTTLGLLAGGAVLALRRRSK